ncbi:conserved hypothetical protein [Tenacibaculum maritimum]|nr:conserved hypothetical protein [Tenacibaculum maritimum]
MTLSLKYIPPLILLLTLANPSFSQKLNLKFYTKDSTENLFLKKLKLPQKKYSSQKSIHKNIYKHLDKLKHFGFFSPKIDSIKKTDNTYVVHLSLGNKINNAILSYSNHNSKEQTIKIPIQKLDSLLQSISSKTSSKGFPFSEVNLKDISIKEKTLFATINTKLSKQRKIDKTIIKGYKNFPKTYLKHLLKINRNTIFNKKKLQKISSHMKYIDFSKEVKKPEVLFSNDSTILFLYLKRNKLSNFNGIINFSSKENSNKIIFNGLLNLNLKNTFNIGEELSLLWRANGEAQQDFNISTKFPYIFNTPLKLNTDFNIYRQDSSYINTKFSTKLNYFLTPKNTFFLTYQSENSNKTSLLTTTEPIATFNNTFIGFGFTHKSGQKKPLSQHTFHLEGNFAYGFRKRTVDKEKQFKIHLETSLFLPLNLKSGIYIKNNTSYLHSKNYLQNEVYRIGGLNSIRGFKEQHFFSPKYSYFNLEYRHLTSASSFLYSISDIGFIQNIDLSTQKALTLGLGYLFKINSSNLNIGYTLSNESLSVFKLKNSAIFINFSNFF